MRSRTSAPVVIAAVAIALTAWVMMLRPHASSNVARGRVVTSSSTHQSSSPGNAVDGDPTTAWNAGRHPPSWIEIDLGAAYSIDRVRLLVEQTPDGPTVHNVSFGTASRSFTIVEVLSRQTVDDQELSIAPNSARHGVRFVKVETISSPSWVAWNEIEVWGTSAD